jgi:Mrp family chromosome partitioning ATPase
LQLGRAASGTLLIVSSRRTERAQAVAAVEALRRARANLLGMVVNEVPASSSRYGTYGRDRGARPRRLTGALGSSRRASG